MSTNYYWHGPVPELPECPTCHREFEQEIVHIGLRSAGWSFLFHGTASIRSESDWRDRMNVGGSQIVDEYGQQIPVAEFWDLVNSYRHNRRHSPRSDDESWVDDNGNQFCGSEFS